MAFEIEWVPDEEENKEYVLPEWSSTAHPSMFWTVDHEKNIKLFEFYTPVDWPDQPYFAFIWKDHPISVQLKENLIGKNTVEWSLIELSLPKEIANCREEVLADLREAMKTFGLFGSLFFIDKPVNVIIKF